MNSVSLIGRLGQEPELETTQNGKSMTRFSIAVKGYGDKTDWIRCIAFGKTAELICNHLSKGREVGLNGSISTGSYEKDGQKVRTFDIMCNAVHFVGKGGVSNSQPKQATLTADDIPF